MGYTHYTTTFGLRYTLTMQTHHHNYFISEYNITAFLLSNLLWNGNAVIEDWACQVSLIGLIRSQNWLPWQRPLSDRKTNVIIDHLHPHIYQSRKCGEVWSINLLSAIIGIIKRKRSSITTARGAGRPRGLKKATRNSKRWMVEALRLASLTHQRHCAISVLHCKKYPDILWRVFYILTEPVPYTFASVTRRNKEAPGRHCDVGPRFVIRSNYVDKRIR